MRGIICCILAFLLAGAGLPPCTGSAAGDDPAIVAVGDVVYTLSTVQASLDGTLDLYAAYGMTLTDEQRVSLIDAVVERFVTIGVLENKLRELGLGNLTQDEEQMQREAARMRQAALENARLTALESMAADWRAEYTITTDASPLTCAP